MYQDNFTVISFFGKLMKNEEKFASSHVESIISLIFTCKTKIMAHMNWKFSYMIEFFMYD